MHNSGHYYNDNNHLLKNQELATLGNSCLTVMEQALFTPCLPSWQRCLPSLSISSYPLVKVLTEVEKTGSDSVVPPRDQVCG